ncbi:MAG: hydrogenase maturation protein [Steroidobacteraceae bacterium]|jgi:putative two-component system hydrogenase maturation factor HypX/HoxX
MRILLLVHSFNSLSQRLYIELERDGHELSVEFDIHDRVTAEAVELFRPDLVLAPFLKRAIPRPVRQRQLCLVVHPGPPGDRGPSALDWAILRGVNQWGVTVLEALDELDAGPVWGSATFPMRAARKSSLYRQEVTEGAVVAVRAAVARVQAGQGPLPTADREPGSGWQPLVRQAQRAIDWTQDGMATVLRKIHSGDGFPGVEDSLFERRFRLFDARPEPHLTGHPGMLIARRHGAVCRATRDGAVWIGELEPITESKRSFKRPAVAALGALAEALPVTDDPPDDGQAAYACAGGEIRYEEQGPVGYLHFDFYNGALSTTQCQRLRAAYAHARGRPTRVIVLMGAGDFWCNGMHLHCIEAAESPSDASWDNIRCIDDLAREILLTDTHLTVAALQGNAAAGGVFLALAADRVLARNGIVLNPHYRNMGNLYGSEYWTYLLPRRVQVDAVQRLMARRLPIGTSEARSIGLIDDCAGPDTAEFRALIDSTAAELANGFLRALEEKSERRARDEQVRPLEDYRRAELEHMRMNFYGFDPSYHIARHRFVCRAPHGWTPLHLAKHRRAAAPPLRETANG